MELLLISNSTGPDDGYLDHCEELLSGFLQEVEMVAFIPFAGGSEHEYGEATCRRLEQMGIRADWVDRAGDPLRQIRAADAVFVGGGNTFRLLNRLYATGLLAAIRELAIQGMPYVGASAGTNIAGPTIKTTNDMPIVQPPSFDSLNLVPFQINPHYVDRDPDSSHQGETREKRLLEYLEENDRSVVALREGAMLEVSDGHVQVIGTAGARLYHKNQTPIDISPGSHLDNLAR